MADSIAVVALDLDLLDFSGFLRAVLGNMAEL
jgi:hypothetical protein